MIVGCGGPRVVDAETGEVLPRASIVAVGDGLRITADGYQSWQGPAVTAEVRLLPWYRTPLLTEPRPRAPDTRMREPGTCCGKGFR